MAASHEGLPGLRQPPVANAPAVETAPLNEFEWDKATANDNYIFVPNQAPFKRKRKNKWTDANETEIARQLVTEKVEYIDTTNPALLVDKNSELM